MTGRLRTIIAAAAAGAVLLSGCQNYGDASANGATVSGKRSSVKHGLAIHVRYGDGSSVWKAVSPYKYRSCQVGERWPSC